MELYIIVILICFIIMLYFIDEIKLIYNLIKYNKTIKYNKSIKPDKSNKQNETKTSDKVLLMYYSPILIKLYKQILVELKKINKYDYKSYYTDLNIKLSIDGLLFFDWFIITYGIIKLAQDTIIKLIKLKQTIPKTLINKINRLFNYYLYLEKSLKNINFTNLNKFKNKKYKHDMLIKLYKIEELIYNLFIQKYKTLDINSKYNKIIDNSIKDKNINTINSKLNIKFNKINKMYKTNNSLNKFFN